MLTRRECVPFAFNRAYAYACSQMGDLYASAIGTCVLQLKEMPQRPAEYDGYICLFDLAEGTDEASIRAKLSKYGEIMSVSVEAGALPPATVRFSTHEAARGARRAAKELKCLAGGIDTLFNERSYDGREGDSERDDDDGRGW